MKFLDRCLRYFEISGCHQVTPYAFEIVLQQYAQSDRLLVGH